MHSVSFFPTVVPTLAAVLLVSAPASAQFGKPVAELDPELKADTPREFVDPFTGENRKGFEINYSGPASRYPYRTVLGVRDGHVAFVGIGVADWEVIHPEDVEAIIRQENDAHEWEHETALKKLYPPVKIRSTRTKRVTGSGAIVRLKNWPVAYGMQVDINHVVLTRDDGKAYASYDSHRDTDRADGKPMGFDLVIATADEFWRRTLAELIENAKFDRRGLWNSSKIRNPYEIALNWHFADATRFKTLSMKSALTRDERKKQRYAQEEQVLLAQADAKKRLFQIPRIHNALRLALANPHVSMDTLRATVQKLKEVDDRGLRTTLSRPVGRETDELRARRVELLGLVGE